MKNFKTYFVVFIVPLFSFFGSCDYMYELKIEGTPNLKIEVTEQPYSIAPELDYTIHTPYSRDISNYAGERYRIKVKKASKDGKLILRIIEDQSFLIIFGGENEIFRCETSDSCGECKYDNYF